MHKIFHTLFLPFSSKIRVISAENQPDHTKDALYILTNCLLEQVWSKIMVQQCNSGEDFTFFIQIQTSFRGPFVFEQRVFSCPHLLF